MGSNKLLDKKVTSQPEAEPVTLEEAKLYMNVDYSEKNAIITSLITASRQLLEDKFDLGIIAKELQVIIDNSAGGFALTGYPIGEVTAEDRDGNSVTLTITGEDCKYVEAPCDCYLKLTYTSGYAADQVPEVYKTAIKEQVLWMFEHLGDEDFADKVCPMATMSLKPYRRNGTGLFI